MSLLVAVLLGIIEGVTEFLPVSSTGHLTIAEKLLGYSINDKGITAFTAIIQVGAIFATLLYFRRDIVRIVSGWVGGIFGTRRRSNEDYLFGWAMIIGSIPIGIIGIVFKDQIETVFRSLWYVAVALLAWSAVMWYADHHGSQNRHKQEAASWKDTLIIGTVQCLALIPGVSRSGATMSAGLLRGLDRLSATKLSFFLAIPALLGAGILQSISAYGDISHGVGWPATIVATVVSFIVAYAAVAWLLKFVAKHSFNSFIVYRVVLGIVLLALLISHTISAT